MKLIRYKLVIW